MPRFEIRNVIPNVEEGLVSLFVTEIGICFNSQRRHIYLYLLISGTWTVGGHDVDWIFRCPGRVALEIMF